MRIARLTFSISVLLLLPLTATAEPITLSYYAEILDNTGSYVTLSGAGTITLQQSGASWQGWVPVFRPQADFFLVNAPADPVPYQFYGFDDQFRVRLRLSDSLTGRQSDPITISGREQGDWEFHPPEDAPWDGWRRSSGGQWNLDFTPNLITFNGMDYRFTPDTPSDAANGNNYVSVLDITASKHTPEPGTFLLAAGGLLSVAGVRRWRRGR